MIQSYPPLEPRTPRLVRVALWVAIVLGVIAILRLLPAGAFVALAIALVALIALVTWNLAVTLAVASAIAAGVIARRRGRSHSDR